MPVCIPESIDALSDGDLIALCDESDFLADRTPLELELIVRLGAALETQAKSESETTAEIQRLLKYEPCGVRETRQKATRAALKALCAERRPRVSVRVA